MVVHQLFVISYLRLTCLDNIKHPFSYCTGLGTLLYIYFMILFAIQVITYCIRNWYLLYCEYNDAEIPKWIYICTYVVTCYSTTAIFKKKILFVYEALYIRFLNVHTYIKSYSQLLSKTNIIFLTRF